MNTKAIVDALKKGVDVSHEISGKDFKKSIHLSYTTNPEDLKDCSIFIVTVPTPIDKHKKPTKQEKTVKSLHAAVEYILKIKC